MVAIPVLSARQTRLLRMRSQGLAPIRQGDGLSPAAVLQNSCGVQAQNLNAGRISMWTRNRALSLQEIETARQVDHSICWSWFMRGTLHLVSSRDAAWMLPLFAETFIRAGQPRLRQLGWEEDNTARGLSLLRGEMDGEPRTTAEIRRLLQEAGLPHQGQAPIHLLMRAAYEGMLCRGADHGKTPTFTGLLQVVGPLQPLPQAQAVERLARRYLQAYAPAGPEDFAAWSGLKISQARQAWEMVIRDACLVDAAGQAAWMPLERADWLAQPLDDAPLLRLLPMFDNYLLGYASRRLVIENARQPLVLKNGIIAAVLLVDGRAAGTWTMKATSRRLALTLDVFEKLDPFLQPQLEQEAASLGRFLGLEAEVHTRPA